MNNLLLLSETAAATGQPSAAGSIGTMVLYIAFMVLIFYFLMIRPSKKEQKKMNEMISSVEIGDVVLTKAGFYGVIIDITEEDVIVEFGSNKNCRIPMQKSAILQVEKAEK